MITREEAKKKLPRGWRELIDQIFTTVEADSSKVRQMENRSGWIRTRSEKPLSGNAHDLLVELEEDSQKTCMVCGHYGKRRARKNHAHIILCEECNDQGWELFFGKLRFPEEY